MAPPASEINTALQDALNQQVGNELDTAQLYFADPGNADAFYFATKRKIAIADARTLVVEFEFEPTLDRLLVTIGIEPHSGGPLSALYRKSLQSNLLTALSCYNLQDGFNGPAGVQFYIDQLKPLKKA